MSINTRLGFRPLWRCRSASSSTPPGSVEAYLNFLRSGGSKFPLETLRTAGVDMTTAAPIESALHLFERRLDELEALLSRRLCQTPRRSVWRFTETPYNF